MRPDLSEGCEERFFFGFMLHVLKFNFKNRKNLLSVIETQKGKKQTYVFRKDKEIDAFLAGLVG